MALTMFWRCEGATLDGTHDYNAYGSITASATGSIAINSDVVRVGSNSIDAANDVTDLYNIPSAALSSLFTGTEGSIGLWVYPVVFAQYGRFFAVAGSAGGDKIELMLDGTSGSGDLEFTAMYSVDGVGEEYLTTTTVNGSTGNWYFVVLRWSSTNVRLEVYNTSLSLVQAVESGESWSNQTNLSSSCSIGTWDSSALFHLDNVFIGSDYDDAATFVTKAEITSYTEYAGGGVIVTTNGLQSLNRQFGPQRSARLGGVLQ